MKRKRAARTAATVMDGLTDAGVDVTPMERALAHANATIPVAPQHRPDVDPALFIRTQYGDGRPVREKHLQQDVIDLAKLRSWTHYHTWNSRHSPEGFPDLVLARRHADDTAEVLFVELKREGGKTTTAQDRWLWLLKAAGLEAYLWRPAHRAEIVNRLL